MSGEEASNLLIVLDSRTGGVVDVSETCLTALNLPIEAVLGRQISEIVRPLDVTGPVAQPDSHVFTEGSWVGTLLGGAGTEARFRFTAMRGRDREVIYLGAVAEHNTEETPVAEPDRQLIEAYSQRFFETTSNLLAVVDAGANVVVANEAFADASIMSMDRVVGFPLVSALQVRGPEALVSAVAKLSSDSGTRKVSIQVSRDSGTHVLAVTLRSDTESEHVYFSAQDVTEEYRLNEKLVDRATRDQLTRLANRESFNAELKNTLDSGTSVALIMLDLDDFKRVNDSLGHSVGDELLAITGHRIVNVVREEDLVARFGGDEFMIMLRDLQSVDVASRVAEKIRLALSLPCMISGRKIHVTTSIGVAIGKLDTHDAERLFYEADAAAYEAKRLGRNRWIIFDNKLDSVLREQAAIELELLHAFGNDGIVPYVQGVYSIDGELRGVEVLVRVRTATGKILGPGHFLDVARQLGMLTKLGEQVYDKALGQLAPWLAENPSCTVSLNADPREIVAPGFARILRRVIVKHRVEPRQIYLEVTETGILAAAGLGGQVIAELREMGIRIAIDDFGTGASSLGYLRDLMIDRIKIDRTFVTNLHLNPSNATITETVIRLGEALGINVVTEGVESQRELDHVASLGTPDIQGYFFHKPEPIDLFIDQADEVPDIKFG